MKPLPVYSVEPNLFLAGAYPLHIVEDLVESGVRSFFDLTESDEHSRSAPPGSFTTGYAPHLELLSASCGEPIVRHSFPIEDFGVPADDGLLDRCLAQIERDVDTGRPVYVHCWGGYGRTGIVVGAWLIRRGRATPETFVDVIAGLRSHLPNHFTSPVTREQIEYVRRHSRS